MLAGTFRHGTSNPIMYVNSVSETMAMSTPKSEIKFRIWKRKKFERDCDGKGKNGKNNRLEKRNSATDGIDAERMRSGMCRTSTGWRTCTRPA